MITVGHSVFVFQTNDRYTDPFVSIIMGTIAVAHLREMDDPFQA